MFVTVTQNKKELRIKVPTNIFPIKSASGNVIYPDNRLAKYNHVVLDLMISKVLVSDKKVEVSFIDPHGRVESLLESLKGKITFTYNDLTLKAKVQVSLSNMKIDTVYTRIDRRINVRFSKFKHTSEAGNFAIM